MSRTFTLAAITAAMVAVVAMTAGVVLVDPTKEEPGPGALAGASRPSTGSVAGQDFLRTYVEGDGRVVRTDQGNDTVSEGQAYGMLVALTEDDQHAFRKIWAWTQRNIQRDDLLLAWHWKDGQVTDWGPATDADLDVARALVIAGERFGNRQWRQQGALLAQSVMEHLTVKVPDGRLLVPGLWAKEPPYWFNPSYVTPAATHVLERETGDHRWQEVEEGSRAALMDLVDQDRLPSDWARVSAAGDATPSDAPGGTSVRYGYDAARTMLRHAEGCLPIDQQVAQWAATPLGIHKEAFAELELDGTPMVGHQSPLALAARAGAYARNGWHESARNDLAAAEQLDRDWPSYYGAAWAVLGRRYLTDPSLGGCPPLEGS